MAMTPQQRGAAMLASVLDYMARWRPEAVASPDEVIPGVPALREEIRREEHGGGMCHVVTECLQADHGWGRYAVTYLSRDGEVVCCAHYVNVLPDGTIVDPTADQFGEGHDVRVLPPGHPEYGRYRPEFDRHVNPATEAALAPWAGDWTGEEDSRAQDRLRKERGFGWWSDNQDDLLAYLRQRLDYAAGEPGEFGEFHWRLVRGWIDDVENRASAPAP